MKKIYPFLYSFVVLFSIIILFYIFTFDSKNHTKQYFPNFGLSEWSNYDVEFQNERTIIRGNLQISDSGNTFAFYLIHTNTEVYDNGELIYKYPVINTNPFSKTPGYTWNFVTLPYENNELEIILTSPYDGYADSIPTFMLGDTLSIIAKIIFGNIIPFILCIFIFALGICFIFYWAYLRRKTPIEPSLLLLGIFAILLSFWSVNESPLAPLLLKNNIGGSYLSFVILMLLPMSFAQFVRSYYQDKNILWTIICVTNVFQVIVCNVLQLLKICDLRNTLWTTHAIIILLFFVIVFRSIVKLKTGNNSDIIKINLFCIMICAIALVLDLILFYADSVDCNIFGRLGFFLYIVILGISACKESTKLIELGKKAEIYRNLAFIDQTTKLYNRTAFNTDFEELSLSPEDICIINFDLNNLKKINDTKGHAFGDLYITSAAKIINDTYSSFAKCYRVGGDEFIVIVKQSSRFDIQHYFDVLEDKIKDFNNSPEDFDLQIAYGVACFDPTIDDSLNNTNSRADKYMYQNKLMKKSLNK